MKTWPSCASLTEVRGGGTNRHPQNPNTKIEDNLFSMNGPAIYKIARKKVQKLLFDLIKTTGLNKESIDWVIPHQASGKAVQAYISSGGFKKEQVIETISLFGNCVAASVPITLSMGIQDHRIKRGDIILLIGTGAGLSAAYALIRY
tara:strand:- start:3077 stop:3517 length:441 start_codon:yes stop_codon:yes gene_type:complete